MADLSKEQMAKLVLIAKREDNREPISTSPVTKLNLELEDLGLIAEAVLPGRRHVYRVTEAGRSHLSGGS